MFIIRLAAFGNILSFEHYHNGFNHNFDIENQALFVNVFLVKQGFFFVAEHISAVDLSPSRNTGSDGVYSVILADLPYFLLFGDKGSGPTKLISPFSTLKS